MNLTIFLNQLWGPVILAVGVGLFTSRNYYTKMYKDLEKDALAVLSLGMIAIALGIIQVQIHNVWDTFNEVVISFLGWALLLKGFALTIIPGTVTKVGNWEAKRGALPLVAIIMLVIGAYLTYQGYLF